MNYPVVEPPKSPKTTEDLIPRSNLSKEDRKLLSWRIDRLMEGGFPAPAATALAGERDVDYRRANELLKASGDLDWTIDQLVL